MKNLKKIISLFLSIFLMISLTACSTVKPQESVKGFLDAYKKGELDKAATYLVNGQEGIDEMTEDEEEEYVKKMQDIIKDISYTIKEEKISEEDKNKATVKIEIEFNDVGSKLLKIMPEYMTYAIQLGMENKSDDEMNKELSDKLISLLSTDIEKVTRTIDIELSKKDDKWLMENNDELNNALTGNIIAISEIFNK